MFTLLVIIGQILIINDFTERRPWEGEKMRHINDKKVKDIPKPLLFTNKLYNLNENYLVKPLISHRLPRLHFRSDIRETLPRGTLNSVAATAIF